MPILTINTGSSSLRIAAYTAPSGGRLERLAAQRYEQSEREPGDILREFLQEHSLDRISVVAHRVVHGGDRLREACWVDTGVESEIERLAPLAPLHNPVALRWIRACRSILGLSVKQLAVFDTAYFVTMPEVARSYALPDELAARHKLQRYGFHGLAHEAMWRRWMECHGPGDQGGRIISLQLGAGCSITATAGGAVKDTSMGFSPLEGLVMATRCGDIDAGLIAYLQQQEGLSPSATDRLLNQASGLLGVSGVSGDMRKLMVSRDPKARLAVDLYCYRARKYIGAYMAVLGGVDAVLFGGGVGENASAVRSRILEGFEWAGIRLDPVKNDATTGIENKISRPDSRAEVWVIPVDEEQVLAQKSVDIMSQKGGIQ